MSFSNTAPGVITLSGYSFNNTAPPVGVPILAAEAVADLGDAIGGMVGTRVLVIDGDETGIAGVYTRHASAPPRAANYDSLAEIAAMPYVYVQGGQNAGKWFRVFADGETLNDIYCQEIAAEDLDDVPAALKIYVMNLRPNDPPQAITLS